MIAILIGVLIFQQIFWSITAHRLVNKLMCRNYMEYKQAEQAFEPKKQIFREEDSPSEDMGILEGMGVP